MMGRDTSKKATQNKMEKNIKIIPNTYNIYVHNVSTTTENSEIKPCAIQALLFI